MPVSPAERQYLLDQVGRLAQSDLDRLWVQAGQLADIDFFTFVVDAFPQLVDPYHQAAGQLAANWFEESLPGSAYVARVAVPLAVEKLTASARWALGGDGTVGLDRLQGTLQRAVFDGARDTTLLNVEATGSGWARYASANACAFCRLLASRSAAPDYEDYFYTQAKLKIDPETGRPYADRRMTTVVRSDRDRVKRKIGSEYHDDCKCVAKAVPVGRTPLDYLYEQEPDAAFSAEQFITEYEKARKDSDSGDPKQILSSWRQLGDGIA